MLCTVYMAYKAATGICFGLGKVGYKSLGEIKFVYVVQGAKLRAKITSSKKFSNPSKIVSSNKEVRSHRKNRKIPIPGYSIKTSYSH